MANLYDVKIAFEFEPFKVLFEEMFFKKLSVSLDFKIIIEHVKKESNYKDLIYSSKWISIEFHKTYFEKQKSQNNAEEFYKLIFSFFNYIFENFNSANLNYLLKIAFSSKNRNKLVFLFSETQKLISFKEAFFQAMTKIEKFENRDVEILKQVKKTYKTNSKTVYFEYTKGEWCIINLLFNAGKYHHGEYAKNIFDKRIAKPTIIVNKENLIDTIKYKALWQVKARKRTFIRIKPNDIALYSNIAMSNLQKAKEIYDNEKSVLWKEFQMPEDEKKLMDYYELIITSIILAYSSIEALINLAIPKGFFYKKRERNKQTGRLITIKHSKEHIERWYTLNDKMNLVLPQALNIPLPNKQKWFSNLSKLEDRRNKIVHVIEKKSNERYSELLEKEIFSIIESHTSVIKFFGKWATDKKDYLLNELPYGFEYDDIMPMIINNEDYNQIAREHRGIK